MDEQKQPQPIDATPGVPVDPPEQTPEPVSAPQEPLVAPEPEPISASQAPPAPSEPVSQPIAQPPAVPTADAEPTNMNPSNVQAPAGQVFGPGSTITDASQPTQESAVPPAPDTTPTINAPIGDISPLEAPKWYQKLKVPAVLLIAIAAIILIAGGGAFAYFGYVLPNKPSNVVKAVMGNMLDPKTPQTYTLKTEVNASDVSSVTNKVMIDAVTGSDKDGNTRIDISTEFSAFKVSGSIIARVTDKELYLKVNQLSSLLSLASGGQSSPQLQQLSKTIGDKWLRISADDLKDAGIIDTTTASKANECIDAYASYIKSSQTDVLKQFSTSYDKQDFVTITKVGSESVNGQKMTKYKLAIDQAKLKTFAEGLGKQFEGPTKTLATKCGFEDTSSLTDKASSSSDTSSAKISDVYLWVNSKKQLGKLTATISDQSFKMTMALTAEDKQADTAKPTSVLTVKELNLEQLFSSFSGGF